MRPFNALTIFAFVSVVALTISGCRDNPSAQTSPRPAISTSAAAEHDGEDVHITGADVARPADYASAVSRIIAYRDTILEEITAARPTKAHRPLDEATFVLEWMPEIARESGVAKAHWESVNVSAQSIRALFDQIHTQIDNGEHPDFASVADRLQEAIDTLSKIVGDQTDSDGAHISDAPEDGHAVDDSPGS